MKAKLHDVDGRKMTVNEAAEMLGVSASTIRCRMSKRKCSLQTVVRLYRENALRRGSGRHETHRVDGQWKTVREVAESLGVTSSALQNWRFRHKDAQGRQPTLEAAAAAYRAGQVQNGGHVEKKLYWVHGRRMTMPEAAKRFGVTVHALKYHMYRRGKTLQGAVDRIMALKSRRAERKILKILKG